MSDAIRSVDTVQDGSCLTKGRLAPEQQLLHVEEHSRRVTEQREALLSQLEQSLALQHAQSERSQRAMQAERRAELMAVREELELRTAQLHGELVVANERLETEGAIDAEEVAALKDEVGGMRAEVAELQHRCSARQHQAAAALLDMRQKLKAAQKEVAELSSTATGTPPGTAPCGVEDGPGHLSACGVDIKALRVEQQAVANQVDQLSQRLNLALAPLLHAKAAGRDTGRRDTGRHHLGHHLGPLEVQAEATRRWQLWKRYLHSVRADAATGAGPTASAASAASAAFSTGAAAGARGVRPSSATTLAKGRKPSRSPLPSRASCCASQEQEQQEQQQQEQQQ